MIGDAPWTNLAQNPTDVMNVYAVKVLAINGDSTFKVTQNPKGASASASMVPTNAIEDGVTYERFVRVANTDESF